MKKYEQIMRYAMQMELDGCTFFKEKAEKFNNATTRKLFLNLAEVEMEHFYFIKEQLDEYLETDSFNIELEGFNRDENNIFESREKSEHIAETLKESDIPDLTILRMAYLIERDYAEFYRKAADNADDEIAKAIFEKLAKWEDGHEKLFKSEYDRRMKEYMNLPWGG
ncbi:ferritin family protein [Proteiniborus sp. MB09-C3]|uniref:ferritin-like domain-containing protein n=1 Tax=Proteiniborus sp. MB09-C3 TaxID=3050072 RepID=UPI00255631CB|nr:ferritin family protein [Proteiniborus sp. MB09-C3]WIV12581.1 ferritin family protein [Proteiniborus sp. MB09-C3]